VSNFSVEDLEEARASLKSSDIVSNQVEYSIITRDPEMELTKYCRKSGITLIAYSPLGHGALFEKQNAALLRSMASIGDRHGKTAAQVALAWLASKDNVVSIPKASTVRHVEENAAAGEPWLSDEEVRLLDHESLKFQKAPLAEGFWQRHMATYGKRNGTGKESF
jgi:diketogulonate reductase-like aldo/keto reductase